MICSTTTLTKPVAIRYATLRHRADGGGLLVRLTLLGVTKLAVPIPTSRTGGGKVKISISFIFQDRTTSISSPSRTGAPLNVWHCAHA